MDPRPVNPMEHLRASASRDSGRSASREDPRYNVRVIAPALCVVCRQRPIEEAWRPFCSERCKLQDLARWLDGVYRVPGDPASTDDRVPDSNHDGPPDE